MTKKITKEEIAAALHGREYGSGQTVPGNIAEQAKAAGLLIVYGESDDIMAFRGVFTEQIYVNGGDKVLLDSEGTLTKFERQGGSDDELAKYLQRKKTAATISVIWAQGGCAWNYHTDLPHATFDIMDDEDIYCRGMVIEAKDLPQVIDWQMIAEARMERIQSLCEFMDNLAVTVGIKKPDTPEEGAGAVCDLITAVQLLQWEQPRARAAIQTLRTVITDADKYLDTNTLTNIGSGSSLHRAFKDVIADTALFHDPNGPTIIDLHDEITELMELREAANGTCTWRQPVGSDLEDSDCYEAECDGSTVTMQGSSNETDMVRCYRCGRKIVVEKADA